MTTHLTWIFLVLAAAATFAARWTGNRVPVAASVIVALVLRVAFAALTSVDYTPIDVRKYFLNTGRLILLGQDPLHDLPNRQWNFLQFMPFLHAAEIKTGLPWVYAVKIAPIVADVVLVWIVSRLAHADSRNRALQYALNPVSLLVVGLHGQVEPVALALSLGGILVLRRRRPVAAGSLLGAAIAAKTWPVLILLTVLPLRDPRRALRLLLGAAIVPVVCLVLGVAFLDTAPFADLKKMASYSSFVSVWTWSGALVQLGQRKDLFGYNSPVSSLSSALMVLGVVIVLVLLRRRPPEIRAMAALAAVLIATSGFGAQYLMWCLPLIVALSDRWRFPYILAAGGWTAVFYLLVVDPAKDSLGVDPYLAGLSWLPATILFLVIAEQVGQQSVRTTLPWLDRFRPTGDQRQAAAVTAEPAPDAP